MSDENDDEIMNKVKIFSSDDEKLKLLGELLSNKSSRDIIKLLINNEMYTNEIADKLDLRVNLVIHHLKKLENLGLLQIRNKTITKKGVEHKHYRINSYFFLAPSVISEIKKKDTLKKIFQDGIKFTAIGFAAVFSWFATSSNSNKDSDNTSVLDKKIYQVNVTGIETTEHLEPAIIDLTTLIPIVILAVGIFVIWYSKK